MASATLMKPEIFAPMTNEGSLLPGGLYSEPTSKHAVYAFPMIDLSLASTSSLVHVSRALFCAISRPETATPPQLIRWIDFSFSQNYDREEEVEEGRREKMKIHTWMLCRVHTT